jgi:hypothetical protein
MKTSVAVLLLITAHQQTAIPIQKGQKHCRLLVMAALLLSEAALDALLRARCRGVRPAFTMSLILVAESPTRDATFSSSDLLPCCRTTQAAGAT